MLQQISKYQKDYCMYLTNKPVCTIVGAGPGIGTAVARRFGKEGFRIALIARRQNELNIYQKELEGLNIDAHSFTGDAGNFDSLTNAFSKVNDRLGDTHVLIYNAAVLRPGMPSEDSPARFLEDFKVNVGGALQSAQLVLPAMKEAKKGTIIFTGGGLSLDPIPQYASLAVGKAGLRSLTYSLAGESFKHNIHVATVTVCGLVKPGTKFDPDLIAQEYWNLHLQPKSSWQKEIIYK